MNKNKPTPKRRFILDSHSQGGGAKRTHRSKKKKSGRQHRP